MNKLRNHIFCLLVAFTLLHCSSEGPFLSKEMVEELKQRKAVKPVENIVFINDQDVYFLKDFDSAPVRLTNSPDVSKTMLRISHDQERIVYLLAGGVPEIINMDGEIIATLHQYQGVKQLDWSSDDQTLYLLTDNFIEFYGSALSIPELEVEVTEEVISATITPENGLLYIVECVSGINQYSQKLVHAKRNGELEVIHNEITDRMRKVTLSKDKAFFMLAYTENRYKDAISQVSLFKMGNLSSEFSWEMPTNCYDFVYDDYSKFLVSANKDNINGHYELIASYTNQEGHEEDQSKYTSGYSAGEGLIYLDWK